MNLYIYYGAFTRLCMLVLLCVGITLVLTGCVVPGMGSLYKTPAAASRPASATPAPPQSNTPKPAVHNAPPCIALALPEGGTFAPFSNKILLGARAAQKELARNKYDIQLQVIDTSKDDWLTAVNALPPQCAVVGGPLQAANFAKIKTAGVQRHVFAFLPHIGNIEGQTAWRFFPSPTDQVMALVRFTHKELEIQSYGIFYPTDAYGTRMADLFGQTVASFSGTSQAVSYPPADMGQWPKAAESLVRPHMVNKVPLPTATFGAVFLPDSWKNMDMLTTSLLYNGEDRQVLLGTSLWEQSLSAQSHVNTHNFALAVFPGAWDPHRIPPALKEVENPNFWTGLGYDFVRFAVALGIYETTTPHDVNRRIQTAQNILWAMAPIRWNAQGQASQQLFLFEPAPTGFTPLNVASFKERHQQALIRFENRRRATAQGK